MPKNGDLSSEIGQLKTAIDQNDFDGVTVLMARNPRLHKAPMGYAGNGPLSWVAECRVPFEPPGPVRLAIADWMIKNGSDVHQGGDGPLMRAALRGERVAMMELLVSHGADVNAEWNGSFPILFAPCETMDPASIAWLLDHGANPNCATPARRDTALDYLLKSYVRSPQLAQCMDVLRNNGAISRYELPGVFETIQGRVDRLAALIDVNPELVNRRFPELDCGSTGARNLLLSGATLLHVAAEYGSVDAARLLIASGAAVDARSQVSEQAVGGQTPLFHAVSQFDDKGLAMARLLVDSGARLDIRAKIPGHYERPDQVIDCTPLGYAIQFPGVDFPGSNAGTISFLRERGAVE
jgi:ankyrin repeat protein